MRGLILLCCLFLGACNQNKLPKDIIPQNKMEAVFWDYVQTDIFVKDFVSLDSTKKPAEENALLQEELFKKHGITRDDFNKSYKYYATHEKLMTALLDSITAKKQRVSKTESILKNIEIDEKAIQ